MRNILTLACLVFAINTAIAAPTPVNFASEVRPILSTECFTCHGPDEKARKAKLRLDIREEAIKSGVLVPGKPDESELFKRVCSTDPDLRMPPEKSKKPALSSPQIAILKRWIAEGAKYADHWSFARLTQPAIPDIANPKFAIRNPIDAFILAKLKSEGVDPAKEADRVTLIRRVYLDLTGLPPSREEVHAFVNDQDPKAYEKLVDRLLASSHYGERLAIWWLDLVRYADTIGYHSDNPMNVSAYRDYVIRAFNTNMPFDQFTVEQLAGDLLPRPTGWQRIASAYNRLLQTTEEGGAQAKEYEAKYAADRVRNFGQVWLGGTLMCAECHNHKFDPYTQADFYSMAAFFADIQEPAVGGRGPGLAIPLTPEQETGLKHVLRNVVIAQAKLDAAGRVFAESEGAFADVENWPHPTAKKPAKVVIPGDVQKILVCHAEKRTRADIARLASFARDYAPDFKADRDALSAANAAKEAYEQALPRSLISISGSPRTVRILPRGNWLDESGPVMMPKTPGFLPPLPPLPKGQARYTRLDLAKWAVSPENPLTARVSVNRLWRLFFGYGIARSLEESGVQGQLPTHPELLNWLASEFQTKWDIKHIVRLMVTSSAYRRSSVETPEIRERDPMNKLFARQTRQRLDAEFIRDTALSVSGLLNPKIGGPSVKPYQPPGYWTALNFPPREWQKDSGEKVYRRGMYTHWQRSFPHPAMVALDAPSREECTCDRSKSNIPQQALVLLNDPEFVEAAKAFAERTLKEGGDSDKTRVKWAFESATARVPTPKEVAILRSLLTRHREHFEANPADAKKLLSVGDMPAPKNMRVDELAAWVSVCRTILNLHETITRQ